MDQGGFQLRRASFLLCLGFVVFGLAALTVPGGAKAVDDITFDAFYGKWKGNAVAEEPPGSFLGFTSRDLYIVIGPKGNGFNLNWTTIIYPEEEGKEVRRRNAAIDFVPSGKAGVFQAVGREDRIEDAQAVLGEALKEYPRVCAALKAEISETGGT